ncbi:TPA: KxxxW cyclic peptide radical SAM maturase [Streptococcus suis]
MRTISEDILFRLEKFGGILTNKTNFERIELDETEAFFLYLVQNHGIEVATSFFKKEIEMGKLERALSLNIYSDNNIEDSSNNPYETLQNARKHVAKLKKHNILSFPLELVIYPSMYCDLKCGFCFLANREDRNAKPAKDWERILRQAKDNGVLSVSILGGEPTRYFDIDNLLIACEELKIKTTITTNAQLIKKSTVEILAKSKYITPVLSLQTLDSKLNFELMGVRPDRQIKLAKYFNEVGKKCRINAVYTKQSYEQIIELVDFCIENKIDRFSVANYSEVTGYTKIKKKYDLADLRRLNEYVTDYITQREANLNFATEGCHLFTAYPELINNSIEFSEFDEMYYGCRAKYTKMEIMSNGDILPCIAFLGVNQTKQNAFEKDLLDVWYDDPLYGGIRSFRTKNSKCLSCGLLKICEGGCYINLIKEKSPEYFRDSVCQL